MKKIVYDVVVLRHVKTGEATETSIVQEKRVLANNDQEVVMATAMGLSDELRANPKEIEILVRPF